MEPEQIADEVRQMQARRSQKRWDAFGLIIITLIPCFSFLAIGYEWEAMKSGLATASIISACIASGGTILLLGNCLDWFEVDKKK